MIDSVLNQTFQDFEIIIVNDGSTDDTKEILDRIQHDKIRIIHSEHKGPSHARNLAISHSRAEIILSLDADDMIAPNLLEKAYDVFSRNPLAGIVFSNCKYFGARSGRSESKSANTENMLIENRIEPTGFFRRSDWQKTGGYSEDFHYGLEDWDFWLSILELNRIIIKVQDGYFIYRKYSRMSECRSGRMKLDRQKHSSSLNLIFSRHIELYKQYPEIFKKFSAHYLQAEKENFIVKHYRNLIFFLKQNMVYQFR